MFPFPTPLLMAGQSAAGGSGPSSKWRVNLLTKRGGTSGNWGITEMEMRATVGGADQCDAGTALASATNGTSSPANAFDNNNGTFWDSGATTSPQWIEYDFASNVDVKQIAYSSSGINANPTSLNVQYYDGATWQTYWSEDTFAAESSAQLLFSKPDTLLPGSTRWRLKITATQGSTSGVGCAELEFRATSGGADLTAAASADGGNPFGDGTASAVTAAFDNNTATGWSAAHPTVASPIVIGYRFPTQVVVTEVSIDRTGQSTNGGMTAFDVQYLDPATGTWTTSWSVPSSGTWTAGETKVFTKP